MKLRLLSLTLLAALLLSACSAFSPGDPLEGTSWQLAASAGKEVVPGTNVTIRFEDGLAGGEAGCNGYGGAYEVDGEKISFQEVASTLMLCTAPEGVMEQEAAFLGSLNQVERFELADGQLQLIRSDGEALTFVPAP
jgi:heat shock protein HslJ